MALNSVRHPDGAIGRLSRRAAGEEVDFVVEAGRQLVYRAATLYAAGEECVTEVSMAKLFATEVANHVAYDAVQMHGGYGYMREFPVEGFFRDVRLWTIASGTSEVMREIITKRLL